MKKIELIQSIKQQDPILANAVSKMVDYIQDKWAHHIQAKNRRKRSMTTSALFMRTVTKR